MARGNSENGNSVALDINALINSPRLPEAAGEYAEGLSDILGRIPEGWGRWIGVDKGWYPLITDLNSKIAALDPSYQVHQVKEKFGTLRFYIAVSAEASVEVNEKVEDLIREAEAASARTCEVCGAEGELLSTKAPSSWVKTLCADHADGRLTQKEWNEWWEEEKPRYLAEKREKYIASQNNKQILVVSDSIWGHSPNALPFRATYVSIPENIEENLSDPSSWDEIWIDEGAAGEKAVSLLSSYYKEYADDLTKRKDEYFAKLKADREAGIATRGVAGFTLPSPPNAPFIYKLGKIDDKQLTSVYLRVLTPHF